MATDSTTVTNSTMATDSTIKRRAQRQCEGFGNATITPPNLPNPMNIAHRRHVRGIEPTTRRGNDMRRKGMGYNNNKE